MHCVDFFILPLLKRYRRNTAENRHLAKFWIEWFYYIVGQHTTCVLSKTLGSLLPTWFFLWHQILSVASKLNFAPLLNFWCAPPLPPQRNGFWSKIDLCSFFSQFPEGPPIFIFLQDCRAVSRYHREKNPKKMNMCLKRKRLKIPKICHFFKKMT